jgi:hypothetical protein
MTITVALQWLTFVTDLALVKSPLTPYAAKSLTSPRRGVALDTTRDGTAEIVLAIRCLRDRSTLEVLRICSIPLYLSIPIHSR